MLYLVAHFYLFYFFQKNSVFNHLEKTKRKVKEEKDKLGLHLMGKELFWGIFCKRLSPGAAMGCQKMGRRTGIRINKAGGWMFMVEQSINVTSWSFRRSLTLTALLGTLTF